MFSTVEEYARAWDSLADRTGNGRERLTAEVGDAKKQAEIERLANR